MTRGPCEHVEDLAIEGSRNVDRMLAAAAVTEPSKRTPHIAPNTYAGRALRRYQAVRDRTVGGFFEMGDILSEVKTELAHGQWIPWLDAAGLGRSAAHRLISIASDRRLRDIHAPNVPHGEHLPADQQTLYQLSTLSEDQFATLSEAGEIHPKLTRASLQALVARQRVVPMPLPLPAPPEGRYRCILADPPWRFEPRSAGGGRMAERHYPTMSISDIEQLPIEGLAADDAVLLLWVTSENLFVAPQVMAHWGFRYVSTGFVWVKMGEPGLGYWTRKGAELCLLGTRGRPKRRNADVPEVFAAPRGRHSEKPIIVYSRIERLIDGPYLELFARARRPGWDAWGNEPELGAGAAVAAVDDRTAEAP